MREAQLLYFSRKNDLGSGGIFTLLDQARLNNGRAGLTGVLVFNRNYFLQCLEGPREAVTRAFARIAGDSRHQGVTLMSFREVAERDFSEWSMGLVDSTSPSLASALRDLMPVYDLMPEVLSTDEAMGLLRRMRDLQLTVTR